MATRIKQRLTGRIAHIVAVLIFILSQFVTVAHAEDDHDHHAPVGHCVICCLAFSDDDIDAPPTKDVVASKVNFDSVVFLTKPSLYIHQHGNRTVSARAPPRA